MLGTMWRLVWAFHRMSKKQYGDVTGLQTRSLEVMNMVVEDTMAGRKPVKNALFELDGLTYAIHQELNRIEQGW